MKYRPEIDGLRAVAVLPVLFFHAGFRAFGGGYVGVDVFFVISGYLITRVIVERMERGTFTLRDFYERRARRILPMMSVVCLASFPVAWFLLMPGEFVGFSGSVVAANTFWANLFFWRQDTYFAAPVRLAPLVHTWSLSVEEQFYLLFPLSLLLVRRWSRRSQFTLFSLVVLVSFAGCVYGAYRRPSANFYMLPSRAWELGVGALLGLAASEGRKFLESGSEVLALLGLALIGYAVFAFDATTPFPSHFALVPVLGTALVIAGATPHTLVGRTLSARWIVGVGLISYSLYLWHQPILAFVEIASWPEPSVLHVWAALALACALSVLTYHWVERPFRDRSWIGTRAVWVSAACSVVLLVGAGLASTAADGWPRATERRMKLAGWSARLGPAVGLDRVCDGTFTLDPACRIGEVPTVVVWGDSYAMHLMDGVVADLPDAGVIQHTKSVCGPLLDLAPVEYPRYPPSWGRGCMDFNRRVMEWLRDTESVEVVFLSSTWAQYLIPGWHYLTPDGEVDVDRALLATAFRKTLREIQGLGIRVVVVSPPPRIRVEGGAYADLGRCYITALRRGASESSCDFPRSAYAAADADVIHFLEEVALDAPVVWLADAMCADGTCRVVRDGTLMYRDIGHLTPEGSRLLGTEFRLYSAPLER